MMTIRFPLLFAMFFVAASSGAAEDRLLPLWEVAGDNNRVYLLGSVHLLRESDYPLPATIYEAYEDAETLVMELDMDDLDPARTQTLLTELGAIAEGGSLEALMGEALYAEAETLAASINIPLSMLASVEPWLAAVTVEQLMLQRIGFDPAFGVESHFADRAVRDGKDILGLEDIAEQLGFLDTLSMDAQRDLLIQTLTEAVDIEPIMDGLVEAWRRGDIDYLETNMLEDMRGYPELYDAVVVKRNRSWTKSISELLDDGDDYLIIVGALHLVGEFSVPTLLAERGRDVRQLRDAD